MVELVLVCCFEAMEHTTAKHMVIKMSLPLDLLSLITFPCKMLSPQSSGSSVFSSPMTPVLDFGFLAQGLGAPESNSTPLQPMVYPSIWEFGVPESDSFPNS